MFYQDLNYLTVNILFNFVNFDGFYFSILLVVFKNISFSKIDDTEMIGIIFLINVIKFVDNFK